MNRDWTLPSHFERGLKHEFAIHAFLKCLEPEKGMIFHVTSDPLPRFRCRDFFPERLIIITKCRDARAKDELMGHSPVQEYRE